MSNTEKTIYEKTQSKPVKALKANADMIAGINTLLSNMDDAKQISKKELAGVIAILNNASNEVSLIAEKLDKDCHNRAGVFNSMLAKETIMFNQLCKTGYGQTLMAFIRLTDYNFSQSKDQRVSLGQLFSQFSNGEEIEPCEANSELQNFEKALSEDIKPSLEKLDNQVQCIAN